MTFLCSSETPVQTTLEALSVVVVVASGIKSDLITRQGR